MLRIAVAENEKQCRQDLQDHIHRFAKESGVPCCADVYSNGSGLLEHYKGQYDVLFLDIQMGGLDGLKTAEEIRRLDQKVVIVFVGSTAQYAIRGYCVQAANFLLKPVGYHTLAEELKKAAERARRDSARYLLVRTEHGLNRLEISAISFIETMERRVLIHAGGLEYQCKEAMKDLERRLTENGFFRCHNAYLVNLAYVESVERSAVIVDGCRLLLSRYKRKPFLEALSQYTGGQP